MTRILKAAMLAALTLAGTSAFANTYPLSPSPDVFIDFFSGSGLSAGSSINAYVLSVADAANSCGTSPCAGLLNFEDTIGTGFEISDSSSNVYLAGTEVAEEWGSGGQFGQVFKITTDNSALWSAFEGLQPVSGFGTFVALDINSIGSGGDLSGATADLAPTPGKFAVTPEPGTMTLALSGLAAGALRRKWAKRKAKA